ncbi:16S rRNA (guanine(527)-N(7))-methyltransferase RsmG [Methyloligella sp. 2.7D]|uniref:16S rRNA (guanine(527)-N(7))-methyltransferase RsmG n=1 Tax=unclassified Methyloligella TaxID=2625955 RepID=UPI00157DE3A9|nr:16S rRNA (guanine(527)-N(7))-methyltransferase RsmG [Methyloligella sp. GL2]QKP76267.1 16S rRNA (guanine(527)-N(7))-methyltransferase RsmG [Methyloligella sp. GL2]
MSETAAGEGANGAKTPLAIEGPEDFSKAFDVSRETIHSLCIYSELLSEWQSWTNLVAASTLPDLWSRHFADSAQLTLLAPEARLWLDLGSGAGFPGLVVAILKAAEPDFRMHVVESNQRKCRFMAEVAEATNAPVEIHNLRIENMKPNELPLSPQVISARALAPLPRLLGLAAPLFGRETRGLFLKGRDANHEIETARRDWDFTARCHRSLTSADSAIVEIAHLAKRQRKAKRK